MPPFYDALSKRLREITALNEAAAVLSWDQQVMMPAGGAQARATQLSVLVRIAHDMMTDAETGKLIDAAALETESLGYDSDEASLVRVVRQDYEEETRLPSDFVAEVTEQVSLAHEVWAHARATNDFSVFEPTLARIIDYKRREADYRGFTDHPYDALLATYERGMTSAQVKAIFDEHKPHLVELISRIRASAHPVDTQVLHQTFPIAQQEAFARTIIRDYGFDFERGRQDISTHPFCTSFSSSDVRITTRYNENFLNPALFGMMHETGHAMYEQGVAKSLDGTPLGAGTSLGVHESQSRMWENLVGRSRGFWEWAYPMLVAQFPDQLRGVDVEAFYRAINAVGSSFIRVEADEATYNLHIMLRFDLERDMLAGKVAVADLPREWNERFEAFFGIVPPDNAQGVLQDVHWSSGLFGYFATYALGNMLASQYYRKALADRPGIPDDIARGEFGTLRTWLNENIHQYGRKFTSDELTRRVTGESIQSHYYTEYLQQKYGDIYGL